MRTGRILVGAAALSLVSAVVGCGGGQTFSAEEFVRDVNREGVKLKLGEPLTTEEEGKELYAVELTPLQPRLDSEGEPVTTGGSVSVYDEDGEADDEYETCRQAADLLCYQLANVVVVLEGGGLEADQLGVAIKRLAGDE
jgi:hypothetical protein